MSFLALLKATNKHIGALFTLILFILFFDSQQMHSVWSKTQIIADIMMSAVFFYIYFNSRAKTRELMLYAVGISIIGEYVFSILLEMYTYSLHNIPLYVFVGHAIVYIMVLRFAKESSITNNKSIIEPVLLGTIVLFATSYLVLGNDVFGFILTGLTLYFLRNKKRERLFYLSMYLTIVFLEQVGTRYGCWWWPSIAWGRFEFLPSANPPSGISFFYFGLDLGCLYIYKTRHNVAWLRMKNIRQLRYPLQKIS